MFVLYNSDIFGNMINESVVVTVLDVTPPNINNPSDFAYSEGSTGNEIVWIVGDKYPGTYNVTKNGTLFLPSTVLGQWNHYS